jgi:hypothetical protein
MRDGRQVRGVGLDADAIGGGVGRRCADVVGLLEGEPAREREVKAQVQVAAGVVTVAGVAVDDATFVGQRARAQYVDGVVVGITHVAARAR